MFPLTLDLTDRRVLAVGGGPVSARRVRALVQAGAQVLLVAPEVCEDLADLSGRLDWQAREFRVTDLDGIWLVHAATGDRRTDAEIAALARSRRLFCVSAGEAGLGTAFVPARAQIDVPEGQVQIAVSSRDPQRSARIRDQLTARLESDQVDLRPRRPHRGWVALVGGGPGNDGLLTRRAATLLHSADVVVLDRLAPRGLVAGLPQSVQVIDVGKTPGHHPVPQHEINRLLVEQAQLGRGVVRLKGGDPFVFGRGEEERAACQAAGVPVEVVPGISSAIAVPAAAGIPVTSRGVARGFTVVTGHDALGNLPTGGDHTLILLMGVSGLARSTRTLIAQGRDRRCPAAIIERGCTPQQRVTVAVLDEIADLAAARQVQAPAIIVIGDVVTLGPGWAAHASPAVRCRATV